MSDVTTLPRVAADEWLIGASALREAGYDVFDALTAYEVDGGLELVLWVLRGDTPAGADPSPRSQGLRTQVAFGESVASLTPLYAGAAWPEREIAEQFGLELSGFHDGMGERVRRLLLPEDPSGPTQHKPVSMPLRKERELVARRDTPWPGAR